MMDEIDYRMPPRVRVVCDNPDCKDLGKVKTIPLPHMGNGVYAMPGLACHCRQNVELRKVAR